MKLSAEIVPSEKLVIARLKKWAEQYADLNAQIADLVAKKEKLHDNSLAALEMLGMKEVTAEREGALPLKAQRYEITKVFWNMKAITKLLTERRLAARVLKLTVDNKALEAALHKGLVSLPEVNACATKIKTTYGFRVDELKPAKEEPSGA